MKANSTRPITLTEKIANPGEKNVLDSTFYSSMGENLDEIAKYWNRRSENARIGYAAGWVASAALLSVAASPVALIAGAAMAGFCAVEFVKEMFRTRELNTVYGDAKKNVAKADAEMMQNTRPERQAKGLTVKDPGKVYLGVNNLLDLDQKKTDRQLGQNPKDWFSFDNKGWVSLDRLNALQLTKDIPFVNTMTEFLVGKNSLLAHERGLKDNKQELKDYGQNRFTIKP